MHSLFSILSTPAVYLWQPFVAKVCRLVPWAEKRKTDNITALSLVLSHVAVSKSAPVKQVPSPPECSAHSRLMKTAKGMSTAQGRAERTCQHHPWAGRHAIRSRGNETPLHQRSTGAPRAQTLSKWQEFKWAGVQSKYPSATLIRFDMYVPNSQQLQPHLLWVRGGNWLAIKDVDVNLH